MALRQTEQLHPAALGLDARAPEEILAVLLDAQVAAVSAVRTAVSAMAKAAQIMAECVRSGGRICYAGAGSSALMANADGMELPGTYGIAPDRILLRMAGGIPTSAQMPGDTEDDATAGRAAGEALGPGDLVIAVTASGSTPYPVALAEAARARGARVVAITNNEGTPISAQAHATVLLPTPPEVIAGSTRMGAATAQKVALNMISTLAAIRLGQVHDGMMVALKADNQKLRARAAGIVTEISGAAPDIAAHALDATEGDVKAAVLVARGMEAGAARSLLQETDGILRVALARLNSPAGKTG